MALTWPEVEAWFGAEPIVAWDRDVNDEGWHPLLTVRIVPDTYAERLWADCPACIDFRVCGTGGTRLDVDLRCRCRFWNGLAWVKRTDVRQVSFEEAVAFLEAEYGTERTKAERMINAEIDELERGGGELQMIYIERGALRFRYLRA